MRVGRGRPEASALVKGGRRCDPASGGPAKHYGATGGVPSSILPCWVAPAYGAGYPPIASGGAGAKISDLVSVNKIEGLLEGPTRLFRVIVRFPDQAGHRVHPCIL